MNRGDAARNVARREQITASAIALWEEMNRRFAKLSWQKVSKPILEQARFDATASYEAMLDAIVTERDALTMLDAARKQNPRDPRTQGPK